MASSFMHLFESLAGGAADNTPLNPTLVNQAMELLQSVAMGSAADDAASPPGSTHCGVCGVGDPEIVDRYGRYFHYFGPALFVNLDARGMVRTLEFVGVQRNNNYIKEVWQYNVRTQKYKYRNLENMQGVPAHRCDGDTREADSEQSGSEEDFNGEDAFYGDSWTGKIDGIPHFRAGDVSWDSEAAPNAHPPSDFLKKLKYKSETFFVNLKSGTFIRGPCYGLLKAVIENPARFVAPLIGSCVMPANEWMKQAAEHIELQPDWPKGKPQKPPHEMQAIQVAQLVFGLTACVAVGHQGRTVTDPVATAPTIADPWTLGSDPWTRS